MPIPSTFTEADNQLIREYLSQNIAVNEIARRIGKNAATLRSHLKNGYHEQRKTLDDVLAENGVSAPAARRVVPQDAGRAPEASDAGWWQSGNRVLHDDGRLLELEYLPETILCFGDMQAPLHHPDSIAFLAMVKAVYQPSFVICQGDEADGTFLKKAMLSADSPGPLQELELAQEYMRDVFRLFPQAICLTSNHVAQRIGYAQSQGNIPSVMMRAWKDIIGAPNGWVWRDYVITGRFLFEHGHLISKGARGSIQEQTVQRFGRTLSIVRGHHHSCLGDHIKPVWVEGNWQQRVVFTGCLMNPAKVSYTRAPLALGCVVIHRGTPHAIPMVTDKSGRWLGKLI